MVLCELPLASAQNAVPLDKAFVGTLVLEVPTSGLPLGYTLKHDWEKGQVASLQAVKRLRMNFTPEETDTFLSVQGMAFTPGKQRLSWNLLRDVEAEWPTTGKQLFSKVWGIRNAENMPLRYDLFLANGNWQADGSVRGRATGILVLGSRSWKIDAPFTLHSWAGALDTPRLLRGPLSSSNGEPYIWQTDAPFGTKAQNLVIKDVIRGDRIIQTITGDQNAPGFKYPDAPGARDIRIEIDKHAASTTYAGLMFRTPCVLNIEDEGLVHGALSCERAGVEGVDEFSIIWRSAPALAGDHQIFLFFANDEDAQKNQAIAEIENIADNPALEPHVAPPLSREELGKRMRERLPAFGRTLREGEAVVRVKNPNPFSVMVGLRSGRRGANFLVPANSTRQIAVPHDPYQIFFVYSTRPDQLLKGDDFKLRGGGIEIQIVQVRDGNFGIRPVN
jgi:hypothetical protein